jgi:hypothetical protein
MEVLKENPTVTTGSYSPHWGELNAYKQRIMKNGLLKIIMALVILLTNCFSNRLRNLVQSSSVWEGLFELKNRAISENLSYIETHDL